MLEIDSDIDFQSDASNQQSGSPVLDGATLPIASLMRKGETLDLCTNECSDDDHVHISFFEANMGADYEGFCPRRGTFFQSKLPKWATGLDKRVNFSDLPTIKHVYNLFSRSSWWWSKISKDKNGEFSRTTRVLLWIASGQKLSDLGSMGWTEMLSVETKKVGLHRLKNYISTLDGLCLSLLFASRGIREMNQWNFYDKVMKSYFIQSCRDYYKEEGETYYSRLKSVRNYFKDHCLKERKVCRFVDIPSQFWYYKYIVARHFENKEILDIEGLEALTYICQTRSVGLPPKAVKTEALGSFIDLVTEAHPEMDEPLLKEIDMSINSLSIDILTGRDYSQLLNRALASSKISISNSSCFSVTSGDGGKVEAARRIFHSLIGTNIRIYDLNTGLPDRGYYVTKDSPIGDVLFHYSIYEALRSIKSEGRAELLTFPGISLFDTRVKIVEEPGKARVITISTLQHALLLHPLAHIFNVLVSSIGSSFTGMKASNHMWDFYKRLQSHFVPPDDIFSQDTQGPKERFLCSEDWTTATDNFHPQAAQRIILGFGQSMNLPKFYVELCATLLTCERRLFDETGTNYFGIKKKGIMMGDPLTKAVLHLGHLVARKSSENLLRYISLKIPDAGPFIGLQHQGKKYRNIPVYSHKGIQLKGGPLAQAWRTFRLKPENDELSQKEKSRRMLLELSAFGPKSNTKGS